MIFATLELARRLDHAEALAGASFVEARRQLFPQSGAVWMEQGGAVALYDGPESPVTQVFCLGLSEPATVDLLQSFEEFFFERGAAAAHDVCSMAGAAVMALLAERGYRPIEVSSVLYLPLKDHVAAPESEGPGVAVRCADHSEAGSCARILSEGWEDTGGLTAGLEDVLRVMVARRGSHCFLATVGDRDAAAGCLSIHGGVALLAGAATLPAARRHGAQRALLRGRLNYAARAGCDLAMVVTEPGSASQRNAERDGFRVAYTRTKWERRRVS